MEQADKKISNQTTGKKKWISRVLFILLLAFVIIQFFQPDKNNQDFEMANDISTVVPVPNDVHAILKTSCYDCHSNHTNYPWYANIQPLGWWLKDHIDEGKSHLNLQEFALVEPRPNSQFNTKQLRQDHMLEEVFEMVEAGEMPLPSYTIIHREAKLDATQSKLLLDWVKMAKGTLIKDSSVQNVSE